MTRTGAITAAPSEACGETTSPRARASLLVRVLQQEDLNFLLTNRIPRRLATQLVGWFSRIESRWLARASIAVWRRFAPDLDLAESRTQEFASLHDCFVRELKPGARPVDRDPAVVTSPCDAVVGAHGAVDGATVVQAKGFPYSLHDLLGDAALVERHRGGVFVTLRLKSSMYHRFHAPCDGRVTRVTYVSGDTWNVNPIALRRVERLFCRNERAIVELALPDDERTLTLVPVAAILVASIRFRFLDARPDRRQRGAKRFECDAPMRKGDELGHFEHGSTLLVFASRGFELCRNVVEGSVLRVGQPLLRRVGAIAPSAAVPTRRSEA